MVNILYLHGFNSSPQSQKAQIFCRHIAKSVSYPIHCWVPKLDFSPHQAMQRLEQRFAANHWRPDAIVGSSLGGFYATYLSDKYGLPAVLINPAVAPDVLLKDYLGWHTNYYDSQRFLLTSKHIDELKALEVGPIRCPEKLWCLVQQGDETLDYRKAVAYYQQSRLSVESGGNHAFENFESHCSSILDFLLE